MPNSNNSSKPPLLLPAPRRFNFWLAAGASLSAIGFLDALYLTLKHYLGGPIPCALTTGCETVTTSSYSIFLGLPVALWGVLYYALGLALWWYLGQRRRAAPLKALTALTGLGLLFSVRFFYLQAAVLKAFCLYCLTSAGITLLLFLLSFWLLRAWPLDSR